MVAQTLRSVRRRGTGVARFLANHEHERPTRSYAARLVRYRQREFRRPDFRRHDRHRTRRPSIAPPVAAPPRWPALVLLSADDHRRAAGVQAWRILESAGAG